MSCKRRHLGHVAAPSYEEGKDSHSDWWTCSDCGSVWNERNTGTTWRPLMCPEREHHNHDMTMQATRDPKNHDDGQS